MIVLCFSMQGKILLSVVMASVICFHFSKQDENVIELTNAIVFFVHFTSLVDQFVTQAFTS